MIRMYYVSYKKKQHKKKINNITDWSSRSCVVVVALIGVFYTVYAFCIKKVCFFHTQAVAVAVLTVQIKGVWCEPRKNTRRASSDIIANSNSNSDVTVIAPCFYNCKNNNNPQTEGTISQIFFMFVVFVLFFLFQVYIIVLMYHIYYYYY